VRATLITDASWCPEERVAGYGYWLACKRGKLGGGGTCMHKGFVESSNTAEMMGVANSLFECYKAGFVQKDDELLIQTDCVAAIKAFEGLRSQNLNLQERMVVKYMHELQKALGLRIIYKHVKGHTDINDARSITNRICDQTAKKFMRAARTTRKVEKLKTILLGA
jgi:ribonuclease HI